MQTYPYTHMHIYTYTQNLMHTHKYTIYTNMHAHTQQYMLAYTNTHLHKHTCIHMQTYMYTCIYPHTYIHIYIYPDTLLYANMCMYMYMYVYTHTESHCTWMDTRMYTQEPTRRHTSSVAHWACTLLLSLSCDSLWRLSSSFYIHLWSFSVMGELITHTSWSCCSDYLRSGHLTRGWMGAILVIDKPWGGSNEDRSNACHCTSTTESSIQAEMCNSRASGLRRLWLIIKRREAYTRPTCPVCTVHTNIYCILSHLILRWVHGACLV